MVSVYSWNSARKTSRVISRSDCHLYQYFREKFRINSILTITRNYLRTTWRSYSSSIDKDLHEFPFLRLNFYYKNVRTHSIVLRSFISWTRYLQFQYLVSLSLSLLSVHDLPYGGTIEVVPWSSVTPLVFFT